VNQGLVIGDCTWLNAHVVKSMTAALDMVGGCCYSDVSMHKSILSLMPATFDTQSHSNSLVLRRFELQNKRPGKIG
jgi:hypothetical protein